MAIYPSEKEPTTDSVVLSSENCSSGVFLEQGPLVLKRVSLARTRWQSRWLDWRHGLTVQQVELALRKGLGLPEAAPGAFPPDSLRDTSTFTRALQDLIAEPAAQEVLWDRLVGQMDGGPPGGMRVVPLGTHCFTAALLKRWGWRGQAGPFDWLFSSLPLIAHAIEDNFERFLDPSEYRPVPVADRRAGPDANRVNHAFYLERFGIEHMFNHHDVHLPEVHQHFVRAVGRFRQLLATDQPKLFLAFQWHAEGFEQEAQALHRALKSHTRHFELHVVAVTGPHLPQVVPQIRSVLEGQGFGAWVFNPVSHWEPLAFPSKLDELCLHHAIRSLSFRMATSAPLPAKTSEAP